MNRNNNEPIEILSLFDGISVLRQSLKDLNINVGRYIASEIDGHAMTAAKHNHPDIEHIGDVRQVDGTKYKNITLMAFGSPCTQLSILNRDSRTTGLAGADSSLFYEALRILNEVKPKYYIMENVASMPDKDRNIITNLLGVEPIRINSVLVGPARRDRLYWTNIPNITQPTNKGITLSSVLENGMTDRDKALAVLCRQPSYTIKGLTRHIKHGIGNIVYLDKQFCDLRKRYKLIQLEQLENNESVKRLFRPMTIKELCRMQTLPDDYVSTDIIPKTACIKALGNCFTLSVFNHLLSFADLPKANPVVPFDNRINLLSNAS
ncbi:DNA cytosine methyltransferase [uncultured Algibacter sp.]|uniref:DNA cytosine methyltransferase n=1 Tax=uncultured Algibacter sp. TaxID=298659 RepID=UPI0032166210